MSTFNWNGKAITTVGNLVSAINSVTSPDEAAHFIEAYRVAEPLHANANVGYCIGYIGGDDVSSRDRRRELHQYEQDAQPPDIEGTRRHR